MRKSGWPPDSAEARRPKRAKSYFVSPIGIPALIALALLIYALIMGPA